MTSFDTEGEKATRRQLLAVAAWLGVPNSESLLIVVASRDAAFRMDRFADIYFFLFFFLRHADDFFSFVEFSDRFFFVYDCLRPLPPS